MQVASLRAQASGTLHEEAVSPYGELFGSASLTLQRVTDGASKYLVQDVVVRRSLLLRTLPALVGRVDHSSFMRRLHYWEILHVHIRYDMYVLWSRDAHVLYSGVGSGVRSDSAHPADLRSL